MLKGRFVRGFDRFLPSPASTPLRMFLRITAKRAGPSYGEYQVPPPGLPTYALPKASRVFTVKVAGMPTVADEIAVPECRAWQRLLTTS